MSQNNQLVSKAIEMQQNTLENSQDAVERALEIPMRQSIEFQKNAAKLFLDGLEMTNYLQNRNAELTRDAFQSYVDSVETVAADTTDWAERGLQEATTLGQQSLDAQQRLETAPTGQSSEYPQPIGYEHPAGRRATGAQQPAGYQHPANARQSTEYQQPMGAQQPTGAQQQAGTQQPTGYQQQSGVQEPTGYQQQTGARSAGPQHLQGPQQSTGFQQPTTPGQPQPVQQSGYVPPGSRGMPPQRPPASAPQGTAQSPGAQGSTPVQSSTSARPPSSQPSMGSQPSTPPRQTPSQPTQSQWVPAPRQSTPAGPAASGRATGAPVPAGPAGQGQPLPDSVGASEPVSDNETEPADVPVENA